MPPQSDNPNPQGKGLVPVLQDWHALQVREAGDKSAPEFLRDYCISSLILSARFGFKPVRGKPYYLYAGESDWQLSLITPQEWGQKIPGQFVGRCELQPDMTWRLEGGDLEQDSEAAQRIRDYIDDFAAALAQQDSIAATLPYYVVSLPYYQRLLATALAASLQRSLRGGEEDARRLLQDPGALPALAAPA